MTRRIDISKLRASERLRYERHRRRAKTRRARNTGDDLCINETLTGSHGKATHGVRCWHCYQIHSGAREPDGSIAALVGAPVPAHGIERAPVATERPEEGL